MIYDNLNHEFDILNIPNHNSIQIIKNNNVILQAETYSEILQKLINYSKDYGNSIINYNQQKNKYYLSDKNTFTKAWTGSFSNSDYKTDFFSLLYELFDNIKFDVIDNKLLIYI